MSTKTITVTEAARNFADCVNRVRYQGTTFVLQKNGVSVARIVPEEQKSCTALELATALAKVRLSPEESAAWLHDLKEARKTAVKGLKIIEPK
jgi:antitoxin (DNA-binding transcriptional repressor) of toxin-antitoxin stability system